MMTATRSACLAFALSVGCALFGFAGVPASAEPAPCAAPCAAPVACAPQKCDCFTCECPKPPKAEVPARVQGAQLRGELEALPLRAALRPARLDRPLEGARPERRKTVWASVGAQVRFRYEGWRNFRFGGAGAAADDSWGLIRLRLYADVHLGEHLPSLRRGHLRGPVDA